MSSSQPIVSVVIPYHNEGHLVNRTLESVCEQQVELPVEIVLVDDASDAPPPIVDAFASRVTYVRTERSLHAAGARNLGVSQARGEYICFLDADDVYLPGRLSTHVSFLDEHPHVGMVGGPLYVHRNGQRFHVPNLIRTCYPWLDGAQGVLPEAAKRDICVQYLFHTGALTVRRELLHSLKGLDQRYRWAAEWDLQVRVAQVAAIGYVPMPAQRYLCRSGSITSTSNPAKQVSAARMYRNWRSSIEGLPPYHRRVLRERESRSLLLAAQLYLEDDLHPRQALSCALRSVRTKPSVWGLRSSVRSIVHLLARGARAERTAREDNTVA